MSTITELDAEVAAAIEAQLSSVTGRMNSDYLDGTGQRLASTEKRYRLRTSATLEDPAQSSQDPLLVVQCTVDILKSIETITEAQYRDMEMWTDQQVLLDRDFWRGLAAVQNLVPESTPIMESDPARIAQIMFYTVVADLILTP